MDSSEILKTLTGVMDKLSQSLGVAAGKLYPILLLQTKAEFFQKLAFIVIGIITIIIAMIIIRKAKKIEYKHYDDDGYKFFLYCLGGVMIAISTIMIVVCTMDCIQILVNPDFYIFNNYIKPLLTNKN